MWWWSGLTDEQQLTVGLSFASAVLGGVISLGTSFAVLRSTQRSEAKKLLVEQKRLAGFDAYIGLQKLMKSLNSIENLARHLDKQIKDATADGKIVIDTAAAISPIVGAASVIDDLTAHETAFLVKTDGELLARIWEIQQRARNNEFISQRYSELRADYDDFIASKSHGIKRIDGSMLSVELEGEEAKVALLTMSRLNQIIVPLFVALDEDRKAIVAVIDEYISAARQEFGDGFPAKKLEVR